MTAGGMDLNHAERPGASARTSRARAKSLAPDAKRFFIGSSFALKAFDENRSAEMAVGSRNSGTANASKDGRVVVAAYEDGAIRWHRADNGSELLALQVLPAGKSRPMGLGAVDTRRVL